MLSLSDHHATLVWLSSCERIWVSVSAVSSSSLVSLAAALSTARFSYSAGVMPLTFQSNNWRAHPTRPVANPQRIGMVHEPASGTPKPTLVAGPKYGTQFPRVHMPLGWVTKIPTKRAKEKCEPVECTARVSVDFSACQRKELGNEKKKLSTEVSLT